MGETLDQSLARHAVQKWMPRLNEDEKYAIKEYTGTEVHSVINRTLRENNPDGVSPELSKMINDIDNGLQKFKYNNSFTVYRGVNEEEYVFIESDNSLKTFVDFKSTSISQAIVEDFTTYDIKHIVIARIPNLINGAYIAPLSKYEHEKEFLLSKDCIFKVMDKIYDGTKNIKYIFIEVV